MSRTHFKTGSQKEEITMNAHNWIWVIPDMGCPVCNDPSVSMIVYINDVDDLDTEVEYHLHCTSCHSHVLAGMPQESFWAIINNTPPNETSN